MSRSFSIGDAASQSGVPAKTIRYHEESGLLTKPRRASNGYRTYSKKDVHVLRFVRRARELGFSINQVGELLALWKDHSRKSSEVKKLARTHLEDIERKILELESLKNSLEHLIATCHGGDSPDCPILDELSD